MNASTHAFAPTKWGAEIRAGSGSIKGVAKGIKGFWYLEIIRYAYP
jgi:hypothetical protein